MDELESVKPFVCCDYMLRQKTCVQPLLIRLLGIACECEGILAYDIT